MQRHAAIGVGVGILTAYALVSAAWGPLAIPLAFCSVYQDLVSDRQGLPLVPAALAPFDEQIALELPVHTSELVTTVSPTWAEDAAGYGPAFLLNGLTDSGYWYQTGITFDWKEANGHVNGPAFTYAVFGPGDVPVVAELVRVQTFSNDAIQLALRIQFGQVFLSMTDERTCAVEVATYPADGARSFVGSPTVTNPSGFFSGLLTEWWHTRFYEGPGGTAVYSIPATSADQVTAGIDEAVPPGYSGPPFTASASFDLGISTPQTLHYHNASAVLDRAGFETG